MPRSTGSPLGTAGYILASIVAIAVGYFVVAGHLGGDNNGTPPISIPPAVEEAAPEPDSTPAPIPTPQLTPTPAPEPSPTAQPSPTPEPEASPTPEPSPSPSPTPSPTPIPPIIELRGHIIDFFDEPAGGRSVYIIVRHSENLRDEVRTAFTSDGTRWIATADDTGFWRIDIPSDQPYYVGLLLGGEPQPLVQEIESSPPGSTQTADFVLPRPVEIRGNVTEEGRDPVAGVPVVVTWRTKSLLNREAAEQRAVYTTDAAGRYAARIHEPSTVNVTIDREALPEPFLYDREPVVLREADFGPSMAHRVDLAVNRGVDISGIVAVEDEAGEPGQPVAGAEVELRELADPRRAITPRTYRAVTGADGRFSINRVHNTSYQIIARHSDFNPSRLSGFDPMEESEAVLLLRPFGSIYGTVSRGAGQLRGELQVSLAGKQGDRHLPPITGDQPWQFSFDRVPPGPYILIVNCTSADDGWYAEQLLVLEPGDSLDAGELELDRLVGATGHLLPGAETPDYRQLSITARPLAVPANAWLHDGIANNARKLPIASTSDIGTFQIENLQSRVAYLLLVRNRESGRELGSALIDPAHSGRTLRVSLNGTGQLGGRVVNQLGEACQGEVIEVVTGLGAVTGEAGDIQTRRAVVQYDGTYLFESLPAGSARVQVRGDEQSARLVSIPRDGRLEINMQCQVLVDVTFELVPPTDHPFQPREQFLVVPKPGTEVRNRLRELTLEELQVRLEPGEYTITRTSTMQSSSFEVGPRMHGSVRIDFSRGEEEL